ncbi:MAG: hypothetical protein CTY19_18115 [Methylomonas sp.]|jgi:hypothetical protein|nr:MAG: hypothetical protein CTY19_18115 [Methylomonas sp.]
MLMNENLASEINSLHERAEKLLLDWLETPPTDKRQKQALQLLAEASQNLHASVINLGLYDSVDTTK